MFINFFLYSDHKLLQNISNPKNYKTLKTNKNKLFKKKSKTQKKKNKRTKTKKIVTKNDWLFQLLNLYCEVFFFCNSHLRKIKFSLLTISIYLTGSRILIQQYTKQLISEFIQSDFTHVFYDYILLNRIIKFYNKIFH